MDDQIPTVDYRWGDVWSITDFINPQLEVTFNNEGDKLVTEVARFIRDEFEYPLIHGEPSADGNFRRFHKSICKYQFSRYVYYMWSFAQETLLIRKGICIDTSTLAASLLVSKLDAWCCLGEVREINNTLLGYHAWVVMPYKGMEFLMETTIHNEGTNTLLPVSEAYNKASSWAAANGIYYAERGRFNNKNFKGDSSIIASMGYPAKRVLLFGIEETRLLPPKKLSKEWKAETKIKTRLLGEAYKRYYRVAE